MDITAILDLQIHKDGTTIGTPVIIKLFSVDK